MNWHVVITKPACEELVFKQFINAGFNVFYPKIKKYYPKLKKEKIIPLFSRYLFIQFDYIKDYKLITYTRGVSKILEFYQIPATVSEEIINNIKTHCDDNYIITPKYMYKDDVRIGDKIQVVDGILEGIQGIVSGIYDDKKRIEILHNLMKVKVNKDNVKVLKANQI